MLRLIHKEIDIRSIMQAALSPINITTQEVHIWNISVSKWSGQLTWAESILSQKEKLDAKKYYFYCDYKNFVLRHGLLRTVLSTYHTMQPEQMRFQYNAYGKPQILSIHNSSGTQFSVSHSGNSFLFAVTQKRQIGVDIERIRYVDNMTAIFRMFSTDSEKTEFDRVEEIVKQEVFFRWWTKKEAVVKAIGSGLSEEMFRYLSIPIQIEQSAILVNTGIAPAEFQLITFKPTSDSIASIAVSEKSYITF